MWILSSTIKYFKNANIFKNKYYLEKMEKII